MVGWAPWKLSAAIASSTVSSAGSSSYSTSIAAAPRRAASRLSPSTQQTEWPKYLTSSGNSGSSCLTPASLMPGTSAAVSTRTTPGTSYAAATSSRVTRAWACGACTGWACSTLLVRPTRSSV